MQTSFWDMTPSPPSKSTPIAAKSLDKKLKKDGSPTSKSTNKTSNNSTPHSTREKWIASQQVSLVTILASQEKAKASTAKKVASSSPPHTSLAYYDHTTSSWKTYQLSLFEDSTTFLAKWSKSGMIVAGQYYPLKTSAPPTSEKDGGACVPTPTRTDATARTYHNQKDGSVRLSLAGYAKMYPTPTARDYRSISKGDRLRHTPSLATITEMMSLSPGQLNPTFVEWLMGFPIGATELKD